jgi:hypothetical protein
MTSAARRVVSTGAAGRIGRAIIPLLPADWDVQRTDLTASESISALDIGNAGRVSSGLYWRRRRCTPGCGSRPGGFMGAIAASQRRWRLRSGPGCRQCRVRRLVLASSLHVVSGMPDQTQCQPGRYPHGLARVTPPSWYRLQWKPLVSNSSLPTAFLRIATAGLT